MPDQPDKSTVYLPDAGLGDKVPYQPKPKSAISILDEIFRLDAQYQGGILKTRSRTEFYRLYLCPLIEPLVRDAARYRYVKEVLSPEDFATIDAAELDEFIDEGIENENFESAR